MTVRTSQDNSNWQSPVAHPVLGRKDIHVWRAALSGRPKLVAAFWPLLSEDEKGRAQRFHFAIDRERFIVARGWLRTLWGRYLEVNPADICFVYEQHGKPKLANPFEQGCLINFNLAHSGSFAIYAFTRLSEIGIDLEYVKPLLASDDIARQFFSPAEVACLSTLSTELRHDAFFHCWTRKEAFVKAKGMGLSLSLDQFDVTLTPGKPAALLRTRWDEEEAERWSLKEINAGPGYVAAIALEAHDWQLSQWRVDEENI